MVATTSAGPQTSYVPPQCALLLAHFNWPEFERQCQGQFRPDLFLKAARDLNQDADEAKLRAQYVLFMRRQESWGKYDRTTILRHASDVSFNDLTSRLGRRHPPSPPFTSLAPSPAVPVTKPRDQSVNGCSRSNCRGSGWSFGRAGDRS